MEILRVAYTTQNQRWLDGVWHATLRISILILKWVSWQNHIDNVVVDKTVEVAIIECRSWIEMVGFW